MAQLDGVDASLPIPARSQLLAVAWLRWRIFVNSFRRPRPATNRIVGLLLTILLRVVLWPILALWVIGPAVGCGFLAWTAIDEHHPEGLLTLLAVIAVFWQFLSLNGVSIAATMSSFDPTSLLRFPLPFGRYMALRTMLGLLSASTVVGCLCVLATAIGVSIADAGLAAPALIVLGVYAWMNIFFARMLAAWLERWLATRRAREIFGALMAFFFIGVQFFNMHTGTRHSRAVTNSWLLDRLASIASVLRWLPPGFAANAILFRGHPLARGMQFAALLASTALFVAIFAVRLHQQFLGEYLSEGAARAPAAGPPARSRTELRQPVGVEVPASPSPVPGVLPPTIAVCLRKEWMYLRGNGNQLLSLVTPLIFVFILSRGPFAEHPRYLLPGALGYALFASLAGLYNIFGADGPGVQLYLLAPVRLRDVVLAKNIASMSLVLLQAALAWGLVLWIARAPIPASAQVSAGLWILFVIGANLTLGTLRSIQAPRKFVPGKTPQMRTPTNRTSALLTLAVLFGSILLQVPATLFSHYFHQPWLPALIFAPLAAGVVAGYAVLAHRSDELLLHYRDVISEELCRAD